jgi:two-component system copper resistance phosphate regulon response regulator CusR
MHILYIEDEPLDAQLVKRYIDITNHDITIAPTINDANAALADKPDLILADVVLGQARSGYTFVRDLRASGYTQPIIAVTGLTLAHDLEACYEAGFTDVLRKPYAMEELADIIRKYE